jgi:hypothetical protein
MNDKIKTIAEYDGWELRGEPEFAPPYKIWVKQFPQWAKMIPCISPSGEEYNDWHKELKYLTSLDWLHPVAMKVLSELYKIKGELAHTGKIVNNCSRCPINGEYIDLFNSVYDGIVYLKSQHNG